MSNAPVHRIDITALPRGKYRVTYRSEILIERTKEPLLSTCRALAARGLKGRLEMWAGEAYPRVIVDIERGAAMRVLENDNLGPRFARYRQFQLGTAGGEVTSQARKAA